MIRSPLAYQGSKFDLLPFMLPQFGKCRTVHDVFGGSGVVSINVDAKRVCFNEIDPNVINILTTLKNFDSPKKIIQKLDRIIKKHGLTRTDEEAYYRFRDYYNKRPDPFLLWVLSKHSFSSLIRISEKTGFNLPFGFRSPQKSNRRDKNIYEFWHKLQRLNFHSMTYLEYVRRNWKKCRSDDIMYFDPPYLASGANVYVVKWSERDEHKLLALLDFLDSKGVRWALSNVLRHRKHVNKILVAWAKKRKHYTVLFPTSNKSGQLYSLNRAADTVDNKTIEVLIKNY